MKSILPALLALTLLAGCQSNRWVRLDDKPADAASLQQARQSCRIEQKMAELERARDAGNESLRKANSNAAKMVARDNIQITERAINAEIDACMQAEGFKRD